MVARRAQGRVMGAGGERVSMQAPETAVGTLKGPGMRAGGGPGRGCGGRGTPPARRRRRGSSRRRSRRDRAGRRLLPATSTWRVPTSAAQVYNLHLPSISLLFCLTRAYTLQAAVALTIYESSRWASNT